MSMHKELSVKSRVRGDVHARFCERVRVKLPRSIRPLTRKLLNRFADTQIYNMDFETFLRTTQPGENDFVFPLIPQHYYKYNFLST